MAFKMTGWSPFTKNGEVKVPGEDLVVDTETGEVIKKKFNKWTPPPPQTTSRKEYIPQSQRKSGNTGVSYSQAWTKHKDNVQSKYKDEASFTKAAKEWNKKNTKKEYTPNRNYNYKPQSLK